MSAIRHIRAAIGCFLIATLSAWAAFAAAANPASQMVHVAVAANFQPAMIKLVPLFEKTSGSTVRISLGSSGQIYAQVRNGAPYDIFLSADQARPQRLVEDGYADKGARITYAAGALALWCPRCPEGDWQDQLKLARRVAIANPAVAPYGRAAKQVLLAIGQDQIPIARGSNVGQAFVFVRTGNANMGLVALPQILALLPGARGRFWRIPEKLHEPILQDGVLLDPTNEGARAFFTFLQSPAAQKVIQDAGYGPAP